MVRKDRLARLEKALGDMGAGRCPACHDGFGPPFFTCRWWRPGGTSWDEPCPGEVYDERGRCRTCGREYGPGVIVVMCERGRHLLQELET